MRLSTVIYRKVSGDSGEDLILQRGYYQSKITKSLKVVENVWYSRHFDSGPPTPRLQRRPVGDAQWTTQIHLSGISTVRDRVHWGLRITFYQHVGLGGFSSPEEI